MKTKPIPPEKIDTLLGFLPLFEEPDRTFQIGWKGMSPIYPDDVTAFYRWANDPIWMDYDYDPAVAGKLIEDDTHIANATISELCTLLTFCVRGERFFDGHWAKMLENGRVQAILKRLQILKESSQ